MTNYIIISPQLLTIIPALAVHIFYLCRQGKGLEK